jgi:hypothetical protein
VELAADGQDWERVTHREIEIEGEKATLSLACR